MLTKINFAFLRFDTVVNDPYHNVYNKYRINCEYFFFVIFFVYIPAEALRERFSVKIKLLNGMIVYMTFCKF